LGADPDLAMIREVNPSGSINPFSSGGNNWPRLKI
jgi:hypothetical protein